MLVRTLGGGGTEKLGGWWVRTWGGEHGLSLGHPTDADLVCVNDVSCYFSLLEGGRPEDKLECEWGSCGTTEAGGGCLHLTLLCLLLSPPPQSHLSCTTRMGTGSWTAR